MDKLPKRGANYVPLTPVSFLERAASAYASRTSIIYENTRFTWRQTYERCRRLASSLRSLNVRKNDVVSVLAHNVPAAYEMHFAVPMAGAVLNPINALLDDKSVATILRHSQAKALFVDYELVPKARDALRLLVNDSSRSSQPDGENYNMPLVIVIDDIDSPTGVRLGELEYEELVRMGDPRFMDEIQDEWDAITLNYTSGTTSEPKGVVYSHRGAYLSTLSLILGWEMGTEPVYLWTLPMFHCNGWTFTWGVAARGGVNVCLRKCTAYDIYRNISAHRVTHMCCAPVVFNIILQAKPQERRPLQTPVQVLTGGAPPPASTLERIEPLGFRVTHAYGLTEATGPALVCEWREEWNRLPINDQAHLKARQGIGVLSLSEVDVVDTKSMKSVPRDGTTMGEIVLRGSSIMKGYYKNPAATDEALANGWFHTGDLGVVYPDGYVEIKDRAKDIIISGGENISSVEVDQVLYRHPKVVEAATVSMPHPQWGESPCAFIVLKMSDSDGPKSETRDVTEADIIAYCRDNLPHFMVPKKVVFRRELPKLNNKIQKAKLREMAKQFVVTEEVRSSKKPSGVSKSGAGKQAPRYKGGPEHVEQVLAMSRL